MSNVNIDNIYAFPAVNKNTQPTARLTTEYNLTSIVNRLVNKESFIFAPDLGTDLTNNPTIKFNIKGYLFEEICSNILNLFGDTTTNIYAKIKFKSTNSSDSERNLQLDGESESKFIGLDFVESKPNEGYYIHLLTKVEDSWEIPRNSYIKFTSDSIILDDGDLDK